MSLEEQITQGRLTWTDSVVHDETAGTLTVEFRRDPEQQVVYGVLCFVEVDNYSSLLDYEEDRADFEAGLLTENLLGIHEMPSDNLKRYVIKTDTREISFLMSAAPVWMPVLPGGID